MPRVQGKAPGMRPSRSISRGSLISTMTILSSPVSLIASAALMVSISALASSIIALMPRWMFWGMGRTLLAFLIVVPAATCRELAHQLLHRTLQTLDGDRVHAIGEQ